MVRSLQSGTTQLCRTLRATQKALNGRSIIQEWRTAAVYASVSHEISLTIFSLIRHSQAYTGPEGFAQQRTQGVGHRGARPRPIAGWIREVVE
jgi:hypothetical protein